MEAPQSSPLWRHPALNLRALEGDTYQVSIDLCQYEAPEPNKVYMAQTVELLATHEAFKELARRCPGNHPHMDFGRDFTSRARTWHTTAFATAVVQVVDKVKINPYVAFVTGESPGGELAQPASDDGADDVEGAQAITFKGRVNEKVASTLRRIHQNLGTRRSRKVGFIGLVPQRWC